MSYTLSNQSGSGITTTIEIPLKNAGAPGALIIYNNSQVALTVDDTEGNLYVLPNSTADIYAISQGVSRFRLTAFYTVVGGLNNPDTISFQVLNLTDLKKQTRQFPIPLGANSGVATVSSIQNDGNVAGTTFVEATPSGASSSDVILTNDGQLTLAGVAKASNYVSTAIPASVGAFTRTWNASGDPSNWYPLLVANSSGATVNKVWWEAYNGFNGTIHWYNVTDNRVPFGLGPTSTPFTVVGNTGIFTQVAGQATAGNFGVPVIVASARVNVVNTTTTTITTFTPPSNGLYRMSGYFAVTGTNNGAVGFFVTFTDPDYNASETNYFIGTTGLGVGTPSTYNNVTCNRLVTQTIMPQVIYAKSGQVITVSYFNTATGTINDFVEATIERLS